MINSIRRNRNIGTAKQGYGLNNKMTIPQPCGTMKEFYERLGNSSKEERIINGHNFLFIIEETRAISNHSCSVNDIEIMIEQIPAYDYGDLKFIVLRQPKRKEESLSPSWGRLVYSYEFENEYAPAIILDAIDINKKIKWSNKLTIDEQKELERLKQDGHEFKNDSRQLIAEIKLKNVRNTQLYRTLLHEFGHYVHYLEMVVRPGTIDEEIELWESRNDLYSKIPQVEKETFAHKYAEKLRKELTEKKIIPFEAK